MTFKKKLFQIVFEAETKTGRAFDLGLLLAILASVAVVVLESVPHIREEYGTFFLYLEWHFTLIFTVEYLLRIWLVNRIRSYTLSFFGIVDLLSILPTYISFFVPGAQFLMTIRLLRLVRLFKIMKISSYVKEGDTLWSAMRASKTKITFFLYVVLILVTISGTVMYIVEGEEAGFTSIPMSIYWAIVTLTTVGYGDISPITPMGRAIASVIMILGYAVIAVPTGIVSSELTHQKTKASTRTCPNCGTSGQEREHKYCYECGFQL